MHCKIQRNSTVKVYLFCIWIHSNNRFEDVDKPLRIQDNEVVECLLIGVFSTAKIHNSTQIMKEL